MWVILKADLFVNVPGGATRLYTKSHRNGEKWLAQEIPDGTMLPKTAIVVDGPNGKPEADGDKPLTLREAANVLGGQKVLNPAAKKLWEALEKEGKDPASILAAAQVPAKKGK